MLSLNSIYLPNVILIGRFCLWIPYDRKIGEFDVDIRDQHTEKHEKKKPGAVAGTADRSGSFLDYVYKNYSYI